MMINTRNMISITEANQNFSKVARLVDETGMAVIMKNNKPRYQIMLVPEEPPLSEEEIMAISARLIEKRRSAYEVLAK